MDENHGIGKFKIAVLLSSVGCLPLFFSFFALFAGVLLILGLFEGSGDSSAKSCVTLPTVDSVCRSITVAGVGTMSVDEYVAGVVEHEFGGAPFETKKAQAVAARSYGLAGASKDENGNCSIGDTSESFQTYSSSPSETSRQAAEETSGQILVREDGGVARAEYSSNSLPEPYNSYGNTIVMSERNLEIPRSWWQLHKTCSDASLNTAKNEKDAYGRIVYGCGHGRGMGQIAAMYLDMEKNYTYDQILEFFYGADSEYKWSLVSSTGGNSGSCSSSYNGNLVSLDSYNFGHAGLSVLDRALSSSEVDELNEYIYDEIDKAGYGTGDGVAAAGQALTYGLEQMGYYLEYRWAGGHYDFVGVDPNWGSPNFGCDSNHRCNNGMDCSGFVSWAIRTACTPSYSAPSTLSMALGPSIDISKAKPGDIMLDIDSHVRLVIKNNGDGTVIVAEEAGGSISGLVFNRTGIESGYEFIDMSDYYKNNCQSSRK